MLENFLKCTQCVAAVMVLVFAHPLLLTFLWL